MSDVPGYEEFPVEDGVVRIERHALEVGIEMKDGDSPDELAFVGRVCSTEDIAREKILLAYALLDDVDAEEAVPDQAPENTDPGIDFTRDKLRTPVLDLLQQDDHAIQLRLVVEWFNREVAGMSVDGYGPMDAFEEFADHMRDRAGVNIARTIYQHQDNLEGLDLDINEAMLERWDPDEGRQTPSPA